jgi:hypothetical protein
MGAKGQAAEHRTSEPNDGSNKFCAAGVLDPDEHARVRDRTETSGLAAILKSTDFF